MTSEATHAAADVDVGTEVPLAPGEAVEEAVVEEEAVPVRSAPEEPVRAGTGSEPALPGKPARPERERRRVQLSVPVVPVLTGLLVVLLGGLAYLWFTRPAPSSVHTADYAQVLEAARSEVVDLTSFDYLTLDQDIAQAKKISIGDLQKESVDQLNNNRKQLTDAQAVVNTEVVGAGVVRADDSHGTVLLVIQSTQKTKSATQPQVVRYRIQVDLEKVHGRWLLSGITGR